ncbi:MAG: hypothetical protein ACUZ8H_07505 [Candidatus Anammoxibacter sp.]
MRNVLTNGIFICFFVCLSVVAFTDNDIFGADEDMSLGKDSYHQSFAPYAMPDILQESNVFKPEKVVTIKVKEITTYEVPVDEGKIRSKTLDIHDLEISEVLDPSKINFHQVDCFYFGEVSKVQTRSAEGIRCTRIRKGNQYWLSDGRKCVEWQPWSKWDCGSLNW